MIRSPADAPGPWPTAPSAEAWAALSAEQRAATVAQLEAMALPDELVESMAEGDLHFDAKAGVRDTLRTYFARSGRRVYVAAELSVFYPGQRVFSPDVLAVRDVDPRPRTSWFVSAEGRGLDLVMEVLAEGHRKKDLVDNVERYAELGIAEYFVLDLHAEALIGYRLDDGAARRRYHRMVPQAGLFSSAVLGLELGWIGGQVRFYQGSAQLLTAEDLAHKLERMVDELVVKHDEQRAAREEEQARREEEQARREEEQARREEEQARREQLEQQLRGAILAVLEARGLAPDAGARARVLATSDPEVLIRWSIRAATVGAARELFTDG